MEQFLTSLGARARERPEPTLKGATVAAGAVLAVVGLGAIALDGWDGSTNTVGILLGLVATAAGYAVLLKLAEQVRPAGVALVALGTFMALGFLFDDFDSPSVLFLALAIAYFVQWGWTPARGAATLLTLSLLSLWAFLIDAAQGDSFAGDPTYVDDFEIPSTSFTSGDDTVAYLSLILGVLLLFAARVLDRDGWHGVATSAVIVGDISFVVGVFGVIATFESDVLGSVLVIVAGLVLALIGAGGGRRFTTWLGGIGVFSGLVALLTTAFDFSDAMQFGIVSVIVGGGLIAGVALVDFEQLRGNGPAPSAPAGAPGVAAAGPAATTAEAPTAPPVAAPPTTQGWHPDPTGRHELRWHDGAQWTANVSDGGETSTDEGV